MRTMQWGAHRAREARVLTAVAVLLGALACVGAMLPGVEHAVTTVLLIAGAAVALGFTARLVARWVRHRREDRADALTAAAWRARHAPHLLVGAGDGRAE